MLEKYQLGGRVAPFTEERVSPHSPLDRSVSGYFKLLDTPRYIRHRTHMLIEPRSREKPRVLFMIDDYNNLYIKWKLHLWACEREGVCPKKGAVTSSQ